MWNRFQEIRWLFHPKPPKQPPQEYVQVNDKNEVTAIASHLFDIGVRDLLPQVQPEIEDLVHTALQLLSINFQAIDAFSIFRVYAVYNYQENWQNLYFKLLIKTSFML
jgi:hypothetical protein